MTLLVEVQFAKSDRLCKVFAMNETNAAVEKLEGIQTLWRAPGRTKKNSPDYESLINKIRVLSAEYRVMVDTARPVAAHPQGATAAAPVGRQDFLIPRAGN